MRILAVAGDEFKQQQGRAVCVVEVVDYDHQRVDIRDVFEQTSSKRRD
jgi:hypothetical protein